MQAPSIPYDPAKGFTLVDCWTAVDVKLDGIAFQSNQSVPCTLYSNQVFTGAQNIDVTVTLLDLLGAMVGVGILGERSIEGCRSNAVGHSDIGDSIGCAVGRNQVLIVFKGRTLYRGEANTTGRTEVRFELVNGRASFSVDGKKCVCPELTALNLTKGRFRLGLSPMKEGQTGLIGDVAAYVRLFGADTKVPVVAYDATKGLSFHDRWRSIDVKDGRELKCNAACQATCYSEQTFKGSVAMRQSLTLVRRGTELIAFGILGAGSTKHCSDFVLGEREIPESVGCLIKGDDIAIMYKDDLIFREEKKLRADPCVSVLLVDGKLYFEVDEKRIDCPALAQLNFKDAVLRLGASLTGKGQVCLLNSSPATKDGSVDPFAPNIGFNSEFGFSFHERSTAFTRIENSRRIIAQTDNTSTVYSSQVINGSTRTKQVVRLIEKGQGKIVFGLIDAVTTSSSERAAADQITMRGITICLKGDEAIVTNQGEVIHTQKVSYTKPQTEIAFTLGGNIKIEVDGVHIVNDKIAALNIANKHYRLGVSVSEKGQIVELITKGAGPPLPDGFVEGDRDLRYKWACWPDHAHTLGDSVTGKQKGSLAFSLETIFSRKVTGSVCSSCYRGEPNRRVFDCADWKCSECDWHLCNECHYNGNVKHVHDRKSFRATPGGVMHEVRMSIGELLGNVIDFGVVPHGLETTFGEVPGTFVTGGSSGWTNGSQGVTTPLKNGDEIWVRVFNNTLSILCNRKLVHTSTIEIQPYRVAIRFGRDGQTVNMINRFITPPRGTCVAITPDRWFLEQECRLVGLDASCLPHDVRAWLVGEDSDGTVRVCVDEGAVPAIWIPKTTIVPVPNRAVPPPSVCQLPDGTKVVRNLATWIFADQDGGTKGNRIGQVMGTDADGWVRVRWSNGKENIYRYTRGIYVVTAWVGNIGDKVTRNPAFWCAGGADGYGVGVVQSSTAEGILTVQWENGATTLCKFNEDAQEVQLAGPLKVPPLSAAADPDVPGEKKTIVAPPMPAANGQPAPVDRADLARIAEQETLLEVGVKPALKLKPGYKPPDVLSKCMLDAAAALPRITQMPYIVEECIPIAEQRRKYNNNALELDESLAIVLYTYDLGTMSSSPVGNDNFYFVLNDTFRSRDSQALFALQPFLYNFKMAWNKLPNQAGTFYRGIPKSATESIMKMYTAGREIYWSSITSLSTDRHVAEHIFARKEGPGGVLMEIIVSESRAISAYSAIPRENEVILEPNTKLVVVQPPTPTPGCEHYILKLLQVKPEKPFVF